MTHTISMPEAETAHLEACYSRARVILEYGSGGSTEFAASLEGKLVISVESDRDWARSLREKVAASGSKSPVIIQHIDIGATGDWGRARNNTAWAQFHRYPAAIWDAPFFRHPDVVLIDGRFRTACLMITLLRITRPVTVLFDDYVTRPKYHLVEQIIAPTQLVGRMAEFAAEPGLIKPEQMSFVISQFFQTTFAVKEDDRYGLSPAETAVLQHIRGVSEKGLPQ